MAPLFEIRSLVKSYGGRRVLDDLSFDIERGECFVILGRSGSGKSVTLRQLNGLEAPDSGTVRFDGAELSGLRERDLYPIRRRVAMLFQSGALFDSMDVYENVAFPLREHTDMPEQDIKERVAAVLATVGLHQLEDRSPSALSGGMRKRVALARSLSLQPEAVLFDEPTTGLDPMTSATIARLISTTRRDLGVTCVVVTHDLVLARAVGNRLAFIEEGGFRFLGTWEEADRSSDYLVSAFLQGREEQDAA